MTRVRQHYDWAAVIPQMQALWGEQQARRDANLARAWRIPGQALPIAPSPSLLFAAYPSQTASFAETRFVACDLTGRAGLAELLEIRNYQALNRVFATTPHITAVLQAVTAAGDGGAILSALVTATGLREMFVERILMWLLKYDLIRRM